MISRRQVFDILIVSFLIIVLLLLWNVYNVSREEGTLCMVNPLVYGADKISEANNDNFIGSGYLLSKGGVVLHFDRYNQTIEDLSRNDFVLTDWKEIFKKLNITQEINYSNISTLSPKEVYEEIFK